MGGKEYKGDKNKPNIILVDLETLPNLPKALEVWTQLGNWPGLTMKATISTVICFGYKVYGEDKKAKCISAWDYPKRWNKDVNDDYEVVKAAYDILINADAVVTQNGKRFDWKFLQTRLMIHGLPPLPKIQHIDTKVLAKSNLFIFNNSLKELAKNLTDTTKMENEGWDLWVKTWNRDPKAMKIMVKYCKQDVDSMEKVFIRLRPFIKEINYNVFRKDGVECCPSCGGFEIMKNGTRVTTTKMVQRWICRECWTSSITTIRAKPKSL